MEVFEPMAKKIKLSDAAKDLEISSQELVDFFAEKGDNKKKPASALTEDEMDLVLEHYTSSHAVSSFDEYFASKNDPRPERKQEAPKEAPGQEKPDYSWYQPPRYGAGNLEAYMSDVAGEKYAAHFSIRFMSFTLLPLNFGSSRKCISSLSVSWH